MCEKLLRHEQGLLAVPIGLLVEDRGADVEALSCKGIHRVGVSQQPDRDRVQRNSDPNKPGPQLKVDMSIPK